MILSHDLCWFYLFIVRFAFHACLYYLYPTQALADPTVTTDKFNKPGHMFPLKAKEGGVLARPGHTEASVDLSRLAGFEPAGAICEICNEDGTMSRAPTLERFGAKFNIPVLYITDIIAFRQALGHKGTYSDWAK